MKWVAVNDRLPKDGYTYFLRYTYGNGNTGLAAGYWLVDEGEWEIEWSDDHPMSEDISHWIEEE